MPATRALCHALAVATGVLTYLGTLLIDGMAGGELARAVGREAIDLAAYWYFAGLLSRRGRARLSRPAADLALEPRDARDPCGMLLFAGSDLSLWPLALLLALILALPGMLTAWLGGLVRRFRAATN